MDIKIAVVLCAILFLSLTQKAELVVGEWNVRNNWQTMQKYLNNQKFIMLYSEDLSEDSLMKVLSLELPLLQQLHFRYWNPNGQIDQRNLERRPTILTHKLTKTLFKSQYFPRLKVLDLKQTNIDDRYLAFLQGTNLTTSISMLNLEDCFIGGRGYQYLSKIKFNNLTHLNISNTLLAEGEAVDALITIICGDNPNTCKNNLQALDLSQTEIMREDFIRLMRRINPDPLRSLVLRSLTLTYKKTYKEGYNYSAFAVLAERFRNLQFLQLQSCMLNDEIAIMFKNWTLPNLLTLNVADNHISDKGVKSWINKQNLPQLQVLALFSNQVGDETIEHLINQDFQLTKFYFGDCKITSKGMQDLTRLSTQRLETLLIQMQISDQVLGKIIEQGDFPNLRELLIIKNDLLTNLFTNINWKRVPKLKILSLQQCNIKDSFNHAIESIDKEVKDWFPSLSTLVLTETSLTNSITMVALIALPFIFPKMEQFIVHQQDLQPSQFIGVSLDNSNFNEGTYIDINSLKLSKRGNQFELYSIPSLEFLYYSQNANDYTYQAINAKIPEIVNRYDFSTLKSVILYSKDTIDLFIKIIEYAKISRFSYLTSLNFYEVMDIEFLVVQFGQIQLPALRNINLPFVVPADFDDDYVNTVLHFFNKFKNLNNFLVNAQFLSQERGFLMRKEFLDSLEYPFLLNIGMNEHNMEAHEVANFVRRHKQTLRSINLDNNFMETDFLSILVEEEIVLKVLSLSSTSFIVNQFAILGQINTKFMYNLGLAMCDLTNEHILAMLNQNKTGPLFPRLVFLDLASNDIRKEGLSALLATGMHDLRNLDITDNSNPQFINIVLTYPTRIEAIQAEGVETYGIKEDLDPTSALNINSIKLQTKSFLREDFSNLAKLDFSKLVQGQFEIYNVYDCQVLTDLLRINERTGFPQIYFANDMPGLNSSCLANTTYQSSIIGINIISKYGNTYLPQFLERLMNTSLEVKLISLKDTLLPPDFFARVFNRPYQQLQGLILTNNYLGDTLARDFFKRPFPNLRMLVLSSVDITDATLDAISRTSMPQLKILALNGNKFTAKGMRSLHNIKNIAFLRLQNCELDRQALEMLGKYQSEQLIAVSLSYNLFSGTDLVSLVSNIDAKGLPNLRMLEVNGIMLNKEEHQAIKAVLSPKNIQIEIDDPINVERINSAVY